MIEQLDQNEIILINVLRIFYDYLSQHGYQFENLKYKQPRTGSLLRFFNQKIKREVIFKLAPLEIFNIIIHKSPPKKNRFVAGDDYNYPADYMSIKGISEKFDDFHDILNKKVTLDNYNEVLPKFKEFLEKHLMDVINGDSWTLGYHHDVIL